MTALAASIGTGNIAGVATAIVSGGPGALFWIWAYGFVAMAIKFAEAVLGVTFRAADSTASSSGPMYYLRDGSKRPRLARPLRRSSPVVAALFTTPFTQPNSMAVVLESQFGVPTWAPGVAIAVLTWLVIIGGVKSIGRAAEKLSPLKVGLYLLGGLFVIVTPRVANLPDVLATVVPRGVLVQGGARQQRGHRHHDGDALRPGPRRLRQRSRLRHRRRRVRHGAQRRRRSRG